MEKFENKGSLKIPSDDLQQTIKLKLQVLLTKKEKKTVCSCNDF